MEILKHETDIDITHKINKYELKAWVKHLKHLKKEMNSLEKMWSLDVDGELEDKFVLQQLEEKKKEINLLIEVLMNYMELKSKVIFCEDFQCDLDIISEHEKHRDLYLEFLNQYRELKNKVFRMLLGKPIVTNNSELKYG